MAACCSYGQVFRPRGAPILTPTSCKNANPVHISHQNTSGFSACYPHAQLAPSVSRRNLLELGLGLGVGSYVLQSGPAVAEDSLGYRRHIDKFDGYSFSYPQAWIQVRGAGADVFFRDPVHLDENVSVEISSPSSSRFKQVDDLGTPDQAAQKVLKQYLTEFMSTRIGVRRESNIISASSRVADDGKTYYEVQVTALAEVKLPQAGSKVPLPGSPLFLQGGIWSSSKEAMADNCEEEVRDLESKAR